jgi:hypothetical protein
VLYKKREISGVVVSFSKITLLYGVKRKWITDVERKTDCE